MGLFDTLKDAAVNKMYDLQDQAARVNDLKAQYAGLDDRRLMEEFKKSSGDKRWAIGALLKDRGYGNNT